MEKVENKSEEEAKKDVESSSSYIDKLLCSPIIKLLLMILN